MHDVTLPYFRHLSIILPAYNEKTNLEKSIRGLLAALDAQGVSGDIVVVDDGSTDGTSVVLAGIRDTRLRVVGHASNQGYGSALASGFAAAGGDHVFFTAADMNWINASGGIPATLLLAPDMTVIWSGIDHPVEYYLTDARDILHAIRQYENDY